MISFETNFYNFDIDIDIDIDIDSFNKINNFFSSL